MYRKGYYEHHREPYLKWTAKLKNPLAIVNRIGQIRFNYGEMDLKQGFVNTSILTMLLIKHSFDYRIHYPVMSWTKDVSRLCTKLYWGIRREIYNLPIPEKGVIDIIFEYFTNNIVDEDYWDDPNPGFRFYDIYSYYADDIKTYCISLN